MPSFFTETFRLPYRTPGGGYISPMGHYSTVTCDGGDCYNRVRDCEPDEAHLTDSWKEIPGWVTAYKRVSWSEIYPEGSLDLMTDRWLTYCRECALNIDLAKLRAKGYKVQIPEGFVEGEFCPDCSDCNCPGFIDNGERPWTGSGKTFAMNPNYVQVPCERCDQTGFLKEPVADNRPVEKRSY